MVGVRVLEVAQWTFVPAAGAVMADWGADVIKIEHPVTGGAQEEWHDRLTLSRAATPRRTIPRRRLLEPDRPWDRRFGVIRLHREVG